MLKSGQRAGRVSRVRRGLVCSLRLYNGPLVSGDKSVLVCAPGIIFRSVQILITNENRKYLMVKYIKRIRGVHRDQAANLYLSLY